MKNNFNNLDDEFVDLKKNDKLNIFSIEDLLIKNIDEYKKELQLIMMKWVFIKVLTMKYLNVENL